VGGPGSPGGTGGSSPEAGAGRLPFRAGPHRRAGSGGVGGYDGVVLSDRDLAVAVFGSGSARVAVRAVAAGGPAAYLRSLRADAAARRAAGALLVRNPHVRVSLAGRRELAAGQVDARLLTALGALATPYHLDITGFGAPAAGAGAGVPLRSAGLSLAPGRRGGAAAALTAVRRFLRAQRAPFRPAGVTTVRLASGQAVLHVEFTAPSPLGLLGAPR